MARKPVKRVGVIGMGAGNPDQPKRRATPTGRQIGATPPARKRGGALKAGTPVRKAIARRNSSKTPRATGRRSAY